MTESILREDYYVASQWQLMWRKLRRHKLAISAAAILAIFYVTAIFCEFFSPYAVGQPLFQKSILRHREYGSLVKTAFTFVPLSMVGIVREILTPFGECTFQITATNISSISL